jgi:hypothetical protein
MRSIPPILAAGSLLGALALCGCTGGERYATEEQAKAVQAPLATATHFQVSDIPVPAIFSFDRNNSVISTSNKERSANLVYKGRAHIERVANFYRDMMPLQAWEHKRTQVVGSRYILEFVKGKVQERCSVTIERGGVGGVRVVVDLN